MYFSWPFGQEKKRFYYRLQSLISLNLRVEQHTPWPCTQTIGLTHYIWITLLLNCKSHIYCYDLYIIRRKYRCFYGFLMSVKFESILCPHFLSFNMLRVVIASLFLPLINRTFNMHDKRAQDLKSIQYGTIEQNIIYRRNLLNFEIVNLSMLIPFV